MISKLEERLGLHLRANLTHKQWGSLEKEYKFHIPKDGEKKRKWAFDFAFPHIKLAIECEGLGRKGEKGGVGRHQSFKGFENDCEKYNRATEQGWRILRFTSRMINSLEAIDLIMAMLRESEK